MPRDRSISLRWRLAATYAAIALITALLLGGLLVLQLERHFTASDLDRLRSVADRAAVEIGGPGPVDVTASLRRTAFTMNSRIEALDAEHRVVADSGPPASISLESLGGPVGVSAPSEKEIRSDLVYERAAPPDSPAPIRYLRASQGPASAGGVMSAVLVAWVLAAAASVAAAAALGYLLSRRITQPILDLARVSDRMAAGDLAARADVEGADEISRLAGSFNQMADRVSSMVGSLQRFVSDAAHQIGTPLTALRTDLEILRDCAVTQEDRRRADRALDQQQRLAELSAGLLRLSRLESSMGTGAATEVALRDLLEVVVDAVASRADQKGVDLGVDPGEDVTVIAPADQVAEVLGNLLDNAIKFTPEGGSITVGCAREGGHALVWVADDGPGIPADERELVFDRFYRSKSTADAPGSGLGLPIARAMATAMGGTLRVGSATAGTRIELLLPTPMR